MTGPTMRPGGGLDGSWRELGWRKRDELWFRLTHRIHFWFHRQQHRDRCTCKGSGVWT